jgi:hypothetical protein
MRFGLGVRLAFVDMESLKTKKPESITDSGFCFCLVKY